MNAISTGGFPPRGASEVRAIVSLPSTIRIARGHVGHGVAWVVLSLLAATGLEGAVIFQRGETEPVYGWIVERTGEELIIEVEQSGGGRMQRSLPLSQVDEVIETVSPDRLEGLSCDDPAAYRDYAEELAAKRKDPEARETALRLYLIAAYLDPKRLGRSALLGMSGLARDEEERRLMLAMAYLMDPAAEPPWVLMPAARADAPQPGARDLVLRAIRFLRTGNRNAAAQLARHSQFASALSELNAPFTSEQFRQATHLACPDCRRGRSECAQCDGSGRRQNGRRSPCSSCRGDGSFSCATCGGTGSHAGVSKELLRQLVEVEVRLAWPEPARAPDFEASWSAAADEDGLAPTGLLRLEGLMEFDPRQCHFRDGQWVEPE